MHTAPGAELEHIWSRVQVEMSRTVDEPTYHLWLEPLRLVELSGNVLFVEAPPHAYRWIRERFGRILHASAVTALGPDAQIELRGEFEEARTPAHADTRRGGRRGRGGGPVPGAASRAAPPALEHSGPLGNPKLTFEQFVIGDCNRLAHAAALAVAEMPAAAYNPLFLCGPPGVGKPHLMSSIASLLLAPDPRLTVRSTPGTAFT